MINHTEKEVDVTVRTLKTWRYKVGYHIRYQEVSGYEAGGGPSFVMRSAYTPGGDYMGNPKMARFLVVKKGIVPELARPDANVCSVGFCEADGRWYGWSHRAIAGFTIGDRLFEEGWPEATENTPFRQHGPNPITSPDEAKQAAINFAASVA